ncbi:MAG: radical SAM/SPASM domain-containing protein [Planctomycetota bacterium]
MKVWACLELRETGALGLPSRAGEKIGAAGRTALEHTVRRALGADGLEGVAVLVPAGGGEAALGLLGPAAGEENVRVLEVLQPDWPRREALRRSRKWSKDGWRLGLGQSIEADAAGHFPSLAAAGRELGADAVISVLPEAALLGPELLTGLVGHAAPGDQPPLPAASCQAPGGFAGLFGVVGWLEAIAARGLTYGETFAWRPEQLSQDPVHRPENWIAPLAVRRCEFRGAVDSRRGLETVSEVLRRSAGRDGLGPGAEEAARIVTADPALYAGRLPRVVEVELTTEGRVPFAGTPAAADLPARSMSRELFAKILDDLSAYDDVLLTLGGWGDPLAHPEVFDFLRLARERGVYGLHLDTPGTLLDEAAAGELLACDVDVVGVRLGADSAGTYRELTGRDDFERVSAGIRRLVEMRAAAEREWPFVAVEAEKRAEVEGELIGFFDRWSEAGAWPLIRPFSDYCGQLPDRATVHLTLAERVGCRRLMKELFVAADGSVPVCRMDFLMTGAAGSVAESSVEELWTSGRIAELREAQHRKDFGGFGLCAECRDWDNA